MLDPATAVLLAGQRPPYPTAYRAAALLIPEAVLRSDRDALNGVLTEIGLELVCEDEPHDDTRHDDNRHGDTRYDDDRREENRHQDGRHGAHRDGHRSVALRLLPGAPPSTVDAWVALQTLRAAADKARIRREVVNVIGLDHLMVASAFGGSGRLWGENVATEGSGEDGESAFDDRSAYDGPTPVTLLMSPPTWNPPSGTRLPTIALLDTGLATHPWFAAPDDYLTVSAPVQAAVVQNSVASSGGLGTILGHEDGPMTNEPLLGGIASHFGHSTFIAGVMRQIAPHARVKAVRIMHSDGIAFESDLICALHAIVHQVSLVRAGDKNAEPIDVVSLSLGYFPEADDTLTPGLTAEIDQLTRLGVIVVAAAGNFATSRQFLPAALSVNYEAASVAPLVSVGALNPNGSVALFSDEALWVQYFAPGAAMVSTFPVKARGTRMPDYSVDAGHRQGMDRDDFSAGFAVWSGTSFATGAAAARIAAELYRVAAADPALRLEHHDAATAVARARAAMAAMDTA
jgi:hypothetical protein